MVKSNVLSEQVVSEPVLSEVEVVEPRSESKDKYFVYILRTSLNTLYIGQTNNLEKRLKEHKNKNSKSAKYIKYFDSSTLAYSEEHLTRAEAMRREWQLKKWTKAKKEALIKGDVELLRKL